MSRPTHVSDLIAQYLTDLHGKQRTEKDKRRVENAIRCVPCQEIVDIKDKGRVWRG